VTDHDHDLSPRMAFRAGILLENGQPLGDVWDGWQVADFEALDAPAHRHGYLERPRGHSKTGDVATEALVELMLGGPERELFCVAVDADQASILFQDVVGKIRRRPDLNAKVAIGKSEVIVKATRSRLTVLSSDAPSAFGLRPSWLALDEMAEWRKRDLWDALWSATGKKPDCRVLVISTAGWDKTSIAWEVRRIAETEADWLFSSRGQCASWVSPAWLEQQKRTLPPHVFARLHLNQWVDGVGAFLTGAEVDAIFVDGLPDGAGPRAIGLDLGLSKDRSVLSIVRRDASGLVVVEGLTTWAGQQGEKVDLTAVEDEVATVAATVKAPIVLDPWQAVLMAQRLRARGLPVIEYPFTGEGRRKLFGSMLDLIRNGRLRSRPHDDLRRELLGLEVTQTASGWRVDHRAGRHDDHVVAVALAAQRVAAQVQTGRPEGDPRIDSLYGLAPNEEEIAALKAKMLAQGVPQVEVDAIEATVPRLSLAGYLEERLLKDTMRGRMQRAGLSSMFDEDDYEGRPGDLDDF
jgi:Phage Terminase